METWVMFYTERLPYGEPHQLWADDVTPNVYLHDHWEIAETEAEARELFSQIKERDSTHCAGISKIIDSTDW